jgi:4-hydroxybenzoate polyprenyltransferase
VAALLKLMRPAHWVKNVFVLAPLIFAQRLTDPLSIKLALLAFVCFCLASSAVYAFNDIRDREEDRLHPVKCHRPIPSGELSVGAAAVAAVVLAGTAIAGALYIGPQFSLVLVAYLVLNLLYTTVLKHVVILDVMSVSLGFVLRVLGGAVAIDVEVSAWLLLCTIFLALFLAFSKRRHELMLLDRHASDQRPVLTSYSPAFLDQMINVVTASTVVAFALYSISPETVEKFQTRFLIYTTPFVLYGIFRYLYLIYQSPGQLNPTEGVVRDLPSMVNLVLWGSSVIFVIYYL